MRTRNVSAAQARSYLAKAEEYLAAAENELKAKRSIAATSLAIHATINAADAVPSVVFVLVSERPIRIMNGQANCSRKPAGMALNSTRTFADCCR
ncbi:MAG: hypothetical protein BMS9Abin20_0204 [Acidimicrobiia bacterium]|nr:MAG: hypothetical protein BMS9Abin20_0204 [Acidimicrobiia bacterium]